MPRTASFSSALRPVSRLLRRLPLIRRAVPSSWRHYRLCHLLWGLLCAYLLWNLWILGYVISLNWLNPDMTSFMSEQLERLQDDDPAAQLRYQWVPYEKISRHAKRALLVAEDARFSEHDGFDWAGMRYAWQKNLKKGHIVAGGSTISQQLAKNLFLSASRTPWRKAEEALITVMLESFLDKQRIFELYLNVIEWGNGLFGIEAASRKYFHVHASQLSASQAAYLAAMVTNPRYYQLHRNDRHLLHKAGVIMQRMRSADLPTDAD
ncbi:MAG: monofunctional biosynthetic peptidoglycan transglycosylase [Aeromonadaceae bacterium]|nr:monofunctional biosynthetic peptidoglycan transglycosylase [Aeromonadaceae bacterium]